MIRTRFAPSPTGFLHIGGLRTALYNYLFAKQKGGVFLLRIEDTDVKRHVEGAVENLIKTLKWAALNFDEDLYIQSKRLELYQKYAGDLLSKGATYRCFCEPARLEQMRKEQEAKKLAPKYDRLCLKLSSQAVEEKLKSKTLFTIRQKIPDTNSVSFQDLIRGKVSFKTHDLDDQILLKSDGYPTYHLANVVDDHLMEITHVIRGEEWLPSTPKHILLYQAFGWKEPEFAHIPLILNKDRSKLSKRQGHVAVEEYIADAYLPQAVVNFIALLGWNPGKTEQEIFSMEELVKLFSLEKVHKGGAIFDLEKLKWFDWQWRRKLYLTDPRDRTTKLLELCGDTLPDEWKTGREFLGRALSTVEEKILQDPKTAKTHLEFYFKPEVAFSKELIANPKFEVDLPTAKKSLEEARKVLEGLADFSDQGKIKETLLNLVVKLGVKNGQVLWPVRVALTGEQFSPGVFEVIWALGKEKTIERLGKTLELSTD